MDDNQTPLRAEFPLGPHMIVVRQPSEGQILALMLSKKPADGDIAAGVAVTSRLVRVVERLIDPDEWETKVFGGLIDETIKHTDFLVFARDILQFDWKAAAAQRDGEQAFDAELARRDDLLAQEAARQRVTQVIPVPEPIESLSEKDEWAIADRLMRQEQDRREQLLAQQETSDGYDESTGPVPRAPRLLP